ncbi:hypothetical protein BJ165DRAFT_1522615 [Panaeolus papilionaceus]|nr:hypothetical protein BJ165DRAFT_1522615 [Panaeolus papilionaceus]
MPSQPQPYQNYYTTAQLQAARPPSFPNAFHSATRSSTIHSPSPLNPNPPWEPPQRLQSPSTVLSEPMDAPDPAMAAEPYQDFEFTAGTISSESSSSASSSIRHMKARGRRSGSGSGRPMPMPSPLSYGSPKSEEYNPCSHGYHDPDKRKFGMCGIAAAVLLFPLGILCLLMDTSRKCKRCGNTLDPSSTAQW